MSSSTSNITPFLYNGQDVRVVLLDDEPWFVAKDVAIALGYANVSDAITSHCRGVAKRYPIIDSLGRTQDVRIISEPDVFRLIVSSKLPTAVEFERVLFEEVLPSIRRHGMYATDETIEKVLADPDFGIKLLTELKSEREARLKAQQAQKALECQIENDRPKVVFADAVSTSNDAIHIGVLAKFLKQNGLDIGQNRLFERLRCEGFLIKNGHMKNMPTQRAMDAGLFAVQERVIMAGNGSQMLTTTTKVTPRGQQYFLQRFLGVQETLSWEKATATLE